MVAFSVLRFEENGVSTFFKLSFCWEVLDAPYEDPGMSDAWDELLRCDLAREFYFGFLPSQLDKFARDVKLDLRWKGSVRARKSPKDTYKSVFFRYAGAPKRFMIPPGPDSIIIGESQVVYHKYARKT